MRVRSMWQWTQCIRWRQFNSCWRADHPHSPTMAITFSSATTTDNAPHATPLKVNSGVCSKYGDQPYLGAGLQCVCRTAGDSQWAQDTRGCLAADHDAGISEFVGHGTCYAGSTLRSPKVPAGTLWNSYQSCKTWRLR